jgi:hypothetical protein
MNHRPFEDWLLDDEPLTVLQKRELQTHLQTCTDCAALAEVDLALKSTRTADPAEGFAARFQLRLEARKRALRWRNIWGFAILTLSVMAMAAWLAWPLLVVIFQSPVNLLASLQAMTHISSVFMHVVPSFIPAYIWLVILLACGGCSLIWVFSLLKITKNPQGV